MLYHVIAAISFFFSMIQLPAPPGFDAISDIITSQAFLPSKEVFTVVIHRWCPSL